MIRLHQSFGAHAGRVLTFDQDTVTLGRQPDSDVAFDPNADLDASGRHAEIVREPDGGWAIRDIGSRNGTFVNGERINRVRLGDGDELEFGPGGPRMRVELFDADAPTMRPPNMEPEPIAAPAMPSAGMMAGASDQAEFPPTSAMAPVQPQQVQAQHHAPASAAPASNTRGRLLIMGGIGCSLVGLLSVVAAVGLWWMHHQSVPGPTTEDAQRIASAHVGALFIAFTRDNNNADHEACAAFAVRPNLLATSARCVMRMQEAGARGEHAFAHAPGATPLRVTQMYRHPQFEADAPSTPDVGLLQIEGQAPTLATVASHADLLALELRQPLYVWAAAQGGGGLRGDRLTELGPIGASAGHRLVYSVAGTAGSPIFDRSGRVIGVHTGEPGNEPVAGYGVRADVLSALIAGLGQ